MGFLCMDVNYVLCNGECIKTSQKTLVSLSLLDAILKSGIWSSFLQLNNYIVCIHVPVMENCMNTCVVLTCATISIYSYYMKEIYYSYLWDIQHYSFAYISCIYFKTCMHRYTVFVCATCGCMHTSIVVTYATCGCTHTCINCICVTCGCMHTSIVVICVTCDCISK